MAEFFIFIFGLLVGAIVGFLAAALCAVSHQADERIERQRGSPTEEET